MAKKPKPKYKDILKVTHKKLRGDQTVQMDINKINASFEKTQGK